MLIFLAIGWLVDDVIASRQVSHSATSHTRHGRQAWWLVDSCKRDAWRHSRSHSAYWLERLSINFPQGCGWESTRGARSPPFNYYAYQVPKKTGKIKCHTIWTYESRGCRRHGCGQQKSHTIDHFDWWYFRWEDDSSMGPIPGRPTRPPCLLPTTPTNDSHEHKPRILKHGARLWDPSKSFCWIKSCFINCHMK